jgi:secreted PhoX family phosphatase
MNKPALAFAIAAVFSTAAVADDDYGKKDFGESVEHQLRAKSNKLFGFKKPLAASSDTVIDRAAGQPASERQRLAKGLKPSYIARNVATSGDMISFWPTDLNYTHLMVCIEQGRAGTTPGGGGGLNAAVQRVNVSTGEIETILHGMSRCDGIRTTQWGTVLATEETSDGAAYEIIDPLNTTGHWIADRGAPGLSADIRDGIDSAALSTTIIKRTALVTQSWEGLEVLDNGVVIGGDELRAGNGPAGFDSDGGAVFRFVPSVPYNCGAKTRPGLLCPNTITDLTQSPLVSGQNYALTNACTGNDDVGQGCEYGEGKWVEVDAATARADANIAGATGYCRPEDLHIDRESPRFNGGDGIVWCWTNTCGGGEGEALCVTESDSTVEAYDVVFDSNFNRNLLANGTTEARSWVRRFVEGDDEMNSHDNLEIQPVTSNVYIIEDNDFGDIWACLPDGDDRDRATDGCVRMLSINSTAAEPTGFIFDGTGKVAYYIVQHGQQPEELLDFESNPVDGRTDDLIKITGFKLPKKKGDDYDDND